MLREELKNRIDSLVKNDNDIDVLENDCDIIEFMLDNCEFEILPKNRFFVTVNCRDLNYSKFIRLKKYSGMTKEAGLLDGIKALAYEGEEDFSHTSAVFESVISLGIYGLRERVAKYLEKNSDTEKKKRFYKNLLRVYDAALRFMRRVGEAAMLCGKREMAGGILHLCEGSPINLYEALQTSFIYYNLQQFFEATPLRTLGRLDSLFYPYYKKEEKEFADRLLLDFLKEFDSYEVLANLPFALCGTDPDSHDLTNELSYALLDAYERAETCNIKLHLLCSKNTPVDFIEKAFCAVRRGNNSMVFMSDEKIIESLIKQGAEPADAAKYHVVGCYECGADGELPSTCNARINIVKALELALNGGRDMLTDKQIGLENDGNFDSYEALFAEFVRQMNHLCAMAMKATDLHEAHYGELHSAPFLSSTYPSAFENGEDLYCDYAAKYNNSSLNAIGLATAVDSLATIRKSVYEDKILTLDKLCDILKNNWKDNEYLRLTFKNKYPKYGQGDERTDEIAKRTVDALADAVCKKPNVKGGTYRLGLLSINWRWGIGEKTAATADGRFSGETVSQNTSASFGADKEGVSAHLISAARIDASNTPNGAIVDVDLHSSAVRGENGIKALITSLKTYFELGGFAVHYNVLDTEILKDAKIHPEKYPNLQVRLCGWNVLFNTLTEKEKDEFIARSVK